MDRGDLVVVHLRDPREQLWGTLISLDRRGIELRGIDLANFEVWCRQLASGEEPQLGPSNVFFPARRLERVTLDEQIGTVPSFCERFREIVGSDPHKYVAI